MTEVVLEVPRIGRENQRIKALDTGMKDATRDYLKARWPVHTAKFAAREFDLTLDQGRSAANGQASLGTIEAIMKRGGPAVALPIMEAVMGASVTTFLSEQRKAHEDHARRLGALVGDWRPVAANSSASPVHLDHPSDQRPRAVGCRVG